jgi:type II secretory pathway component GspD/PulD (secretin)
MRLIHTLLMLLLCLSAFAASADEVEVIPLRHRTIEQIIPTLQPLLDAGGAITGANNALIVRSSRANIEDLKRIVTTLDSLPRRLLISVRQDVSADVARRELQASGTASGAHGSISIGEPPRPDSGATVRLLDSSSASDERNVSRVQALEGSPAYIAVGQSIPVPADRVVRTPYGSDVHRSVEYRDLNTGFAVIPRLAGDRVTLDIAPQRDVPGAYGRGSADTQRIVTSASGRLGEWFELGGMVRDAARDDGRTLSSRTRGERGFRGVWVRVDEIK